MAKTYKLSELKALIHANATAGCTASMPPLFESEAAYEQWKKQRNVKQLRRRKESLTDATRLFLGIDSGSTTTKILIIDENDRIVFAWYAANQGNPLAKAIDGLHEFEKSMYVEQINTGREEIREKPFNPRHPCAKSPLQNIAASCATGYGEELVKSALNLDFGIVETVAHFTGAQYADPDVSFILDIGGQDMKSIFVENGAISRMELNEACSSGCGSFLQNFAATMNMSLPSFTNVACTAQAPADLGTRCTVFMNSKVKQALRENATIGDIAAGLACSTVKNCLFKVLKINNLNSLGEHIVVQGGAFRNDAVYRALEQLSGKHVSSTDMPEMMGALGAALYARKQAAGKTGNKLVSVSDMPTPETKELECKGCSNACRVLRFRFANGNVCFAGNKCEKVFFNKATTSRKGYNAFEEKSTALFGAKTGADSTPAEISEKPSNPCRQCAPLKIGIPRVLNMYENYPFWQTLLEECGFEVVLSPESTMKLYEKGAGYVMSDNLCFPAKLVQGHVLALLEAGVDRIFYPLVMREEKEAESMCNSYNCPIVSGYPDVIRSAIAPEDKYGVPLDKPVITFHDEKILKEQCRTVIASLPRNICGEQEIMASAAMTEARFDAAFARASAVRHTWKAAFVAHQQDVLKNCIDNGALCIIVAGRPYHADPLIQQKVGQILSDLGAHVLTDDVFCAENSNGFRRLNMVSQWSYPNRAVHAALNVAKLPENVQFLQLNSFGCGPDSFLIDEIGEILRQVGKPHTVLRIDEIASPGSIRLRLRSLIESLRNAETMPGRGKEYVGYKTAYTKRDRRKTILIPWFADFLSPFLPAIGKLGGYRVVNLPKANRHTVDAGLKYGNNEVCYPATRILGDIITVLQSGKYSPADVVVAISQTGGQCRATNYLALIKTGLKNAGFDSIPVLAITGGKVYQNEQKDFDFPLLKCANIIVHTLLYADSLQQMFASSVVREVHTGDTQALFDMYIVRGIEAVERNSSKMLLKLLEQAVEDFNRVEIEARTAEKIGLAGEIYLKYNSYAQAHVSDWLRMQGVEVVTPPVMDFFMQYFVNAQVNDITGVERKALTERLLSPTALRMLNRRIEKVNGIMKSYCRYRPAETIFEKADCAAEILDLSNQFGEGWQIAAEVAACARSGIHKVICLQPFGCIANHVVAKGVERRLKKFYPQMNLLFLDIDGGTAEVNLQNRLHFMLAHPERQEAG
ncbi:MAG: acyl-CoA dehydratase activase-related protein [Bacteroidales bacterium]|jgi:predicted nucleotide-binding protein (sugar kinase/HSP70/actin superfamily)/activator of 2-hydroxyglutaryl-CoA dehydratase|nr:acyl-CoA dehydratase activase-related protein [Bacteroidales bacterium]